MLLQRTGIRCAWLRICCCFNVSILFCAGTVAILAGIYVLKTSRAEKKAGKNQQFGTFVRKRGKNVTD